MAKTTVTLEFDLLTQALTSGVQGILHDNIENFKKCVSEEVHKSVYPMYPETLNYSRRGDGGGLSDPNNYEVVESDLTLTLTNKTRSNPNYWKYTYSIPITDVVEEGSGYGWEDVPARPFMDKALDRFAHEFIEPSINAMLGGK